MSTTFRLIQYPKKYNRPEVLIHHECEDELRDIVDRSGQKGALSVKLRSSLDFLVQHKWNAPQYKKAFEKLREVDGLYSMHIVSVNNLRVLYVIKKDVIYLLCAFAEKAGATSKTKSYRAYIPVAQSREKEIKEE